MGTRRSAREMAMQMLYQREQGASTIEQIFEGFGPGGCGDVSALDGGSKVEEINTDQETAARIRSQIKPPPSTSSEEAALTPEQSAQREEAFEHARELVEGAIRNGPAIDAVIRRFAQNWRIERMPVIDRSILRLAIYEMLFASHAPKVVVVDEAIELAKKFGSEQSGGFVNGLLDGVLKADDPSGEAG